MKLIITCLTKGLRITGTTLDGVCEQNDYAAFGDQYQIEINSNDCLEYVKEVF